MPPHDRTPPACALAARALAARALAACALALLALGAGACDSRLAPPAAVAFLTTADTTAGLVATPASLDLRVGTSATLVVTGAAALLPAVFSTSDPNVATVTAGGQVVGVGVGTATITVASSTDPTRRTSVVVRVAGP